MHYLGFDPATSASEVRGSALELSRLMGIMILFLLMETESSPLLDVSWVVMFIGCHGNRGDVMDLSFISRDVIGLPLNEGRQIVVRVLRNENHFWRLGQVSRDCRGLS